MNNQNNKFAAVRLPQILRSPRWLAMMFLLPLLAMVHFALAAPASVDPMADPLAAPAAVVDKFEHAKIGYNLSGAHVAARCTSCHINSVFKGTPRDCATCHIVGNHYGATAKPAKHVATNVQCDTCHKTTLWTPAFFSHVGIAIGTCGTCHNGTNAKGKADAATPHPLTALDCSSCHTTISFIGAASVLPANHLPTTQPCSLCHAIGYGAGSGLMNHAGIVSNCNSCHNEQTFAVGVTPKRKQDAAVTHLTTSLDCSSCHTSTTSFTGATMTVLPAGHFPSAQSCALCHAPRGFGANSGIMNHLGITNNCVQCHNGQTFAVGAQPKYKPTGTPPHVPTTGSCEACHSANQIDPGGFLITTIPMMNHAGITNNCNTCHNGQVFVGVTPTRKTSTPTHNATTKDCSVCHNSTATFTGAVGELPLGHLASSQPCSSCHLNGNYGPGSGMMNHFGIINNCSSCHAGQTFAVGMKPKSKSTAHFPTTSVPNGTRCEICHLPSNTNGGEFSLGAMSHTGIATGCASCHGGTAYAGAPLAKSVNHIPTTAMTNGAQCETCHSTSNTNAGGFLIGVAMKHTGIINNCVACHADNKNYPRALRMIDDPTPPHVAISGMDCSSCHTSTTTFRGASLTVLPAGHLVTTQACSSCHQAGYGSNSGVMKHDGIINNCTSCHNGQTFTVGMRPKSKSTAHFPTTAVPNGAVCETCHLAINTNAGGFDLGTMTQHAVVTNCVSCHNDGLNYAGAPKRKQDATMPHVATTLDCKACHIGTTTFKGVSAMPANHIPTAQPCITCHANGYALGLTIMNHSGITTGCANCHNGQTFVGPQTPMKKPTNHIPYATKLLNGTGMQCEFCHKLTTAFTLDVTSTVMHNGSQGKGSGWCIGCHLSGTSYLGVQGRKSLTHDAPGHTDCSDSGCHRPLGNQGAAYNSW